MDRDYRTEIATLRQTYAAWSSWHQDVDGVLASTTGPALFLASGGSLSVAHLAADLHRRRTGALTCVLTPLEFRAAPVEAALAVVISDSVGHPDVLAALAALAATRRRTGTRIVVLCNRERSELGLETAECEVITCPRPGRDGYVATNSVLSLSLGVVAAYGMTEAVGGAGRIPDYDELAGRWFDKGRLPADSDVRHRDVLALYGPGLANAGVDLETRTAEAGLSRTVTTDIRNLGHGRHVGLYRTAERTSLILLCDQRWPALPAATLAALPAGLDVRVWRADRPWPWSSIELLFGSFAFLAARAEDAGTDPGNPVTWPPLAALFRLGGVTE